MVSQVRYLVEGGPRGAVRAIAAKEDRAEAEKLAAEKEAQLGVVFRVREVRW